MLHRLPSGACRRLRRAGARARRARLGQHVAGRRAGRAAPRLRAHGALHHGRCRQAQPMADRARGRFGVSTGREPEARADGRTRARARGSGGSGAPLGARGRAHRSSRRADAGAAAGDERGEACAWIPTDGYAEPYTLAMALARAARRLGVKMRTQTPVTGITLNRERVTGIETASGPITCETVVVAVGPWSELIGAALGLRFDAIPIR